MNAIIINKKSYKLYEGKRGGKYIMKGGKKIYQKNLNKEQTGSGFFGKDKKNNVSIKSPDMKHSVELVCEVCKEKEWKVISASKDINSISCEIKKTLLEAFEKA